MHHGPSSLLKIKPLSISGLILVVGFKGRRGYKGSSCNVHSRREGDTLTNLMGGYVQRRREEKVLCEGSTLGDFVGAKEWVQNGSFNNA